MAGGAWLVEMSGACSNCPSATVLVAANLEVCPVCDRVQLAERS
jgi:Fe-S cluster biogenesis protein NfuA